MSIHENEREGFCHDCGKRRWMPVNLSLCDECRDEKTFNGEDLLAWLGHDVASALHALIGEVDHQSLDPLEDFYAALDGIAATGELKDRWHASNEVRMKGANAVAHMTFSHGTEHPDYDSTCECTVCGTRCSCPPYAENH